MKASPKRLSLPKSSTILKMLFFLILRKAAYKKRNFEKYLSLFIFSKAGFTAQF